MSDRDVKTFFDNSTEVYRSGLKPGTEKKLSFINQRAADDDLFLDMGCGSGAFMRAVREQTPIESTYGFDISAEMLPDQDPELQVFQANVRRPPIKPGSVRFVHMDTVLHHLVGETRAESKRIAEETVENALDLLEPDGYLILTELHQVARIAPDKVLSRLMFDGLKYATFLAKPFSGNVRHGQPPISFYIESELENIFERAGGQMVARDVHTHAGYRAIRRMIQSETRRITFFIELTQDADPGTL